MDDCILLIRHRVPSDTLQDANLSGANLRGANLRKQS
ncbi:MAG: hypothetical protein F6J93_28280 [Oscillatoria sp. SIO1A7]|nr:hypothetical protein [Oscillatoria sp. SIO1A7]